MAVLQKVRTHIAGQTGAAAREGTQDDANPRGRSPASTRDTSEILFSSTVSALGTIIADPRVTHASELWLIELEKLQFASLAEASFAEDWESEADAVYDNT